MTLTPFLLIIAEMKASLKTITVLKDTMSLSRLTHYKCFHRTGIITVLINKLTHHINTLKVTVNFNQSILFQIKLQNFNLLKDYNILRFSIPRAIFQMHQNKTNMKDQLNFHHSLFSVHRLLNQMTILLCLRTELQNRSHILSKPRLKVISAPISVVLSKDPLS